MTRLRVAPIVEGHGEEAALPILLRRIWNEVIHGEYLDVLHPIRRKRQRLAANKEGDLEKAVALAAAKLANPRPMETRPPVADPELILVLLDADSDPPCVLGPELLQIARSVHQDKSVACVLANVEFETWFVAAAESLSSCFTVVPDHVPENPETTRNGKGWIKKHLPRYSETVDQPKLTAAMDLRLCRSRSSSFDKLCRELEARAGH